MTKFSIDFNVFFFEFSMTYNNNNKQQQLFGKQDDVLFCFVFLHGALEKIVKMKIYGETLGKWSSKFTLHLTHLNVIYDVGGRPDKQHFWILNLNYITLSFIFFNHYEGMWRQKECEVKEKWKIFTLFIQNFLCFHKSKKFLAKIGKNLCKLVLCCCCCFF